MERSSHLVDPETMQMGVMMGLVRPPHAEWDPGAGVWRVRARPRQEGHSWVLRGEQGPAAFGAWEPARETALDLQKRGTIFLVGAR
ncbi:MAG: hypothetical protein ACLFRB_02900 [Thiohalorhabdus sp.]|uniref:hypothetical protein n=1 Tax=Thiohalorhabdus sp. TaxID=3094134 RepID=UPI00398158C6